MAVASANAERVFIGRHAIKRTAMTVVDFVLTREEVAALDVSALEIRRGAVESIDPSADIFADDAKWAVNEGSFRSDDVLNVRCHVFSIRIDRIQNARRAAANIAASA